MKAIVFVLALGALLWLFLSGSASDAGYLLKQGRYLLRYGTGAKDIDSMLRDKNTPADLRAFLSTVKDIKRFAVNDIGLKDNANYTRYKKIDRDYLVEVVQACDAASFTPYLWRYPFFGGLPYKGFYEHADAEAEADRLRKKGYDVIVRKADAFSTLGFLKDPVYSFMREYSTYDLASLIIHEQTHATVFLRGQPGFNEELASFVGDEGGLLYVKGRFGPDSAQYHGALAERSDSRLFLSAVRDLRGRLEELYTGPFSRPEKLQRKKVIIGSFKERFDREYAPRFANPDYRKAMDGPINNAYLSLFDLYTKEIPLLETYSRRECGSDLKVFMAKVAALSRSPGDLEEKMRRELGMEPNARLPALETGP